MGTTRIDSPMSTLEVHRLHRVPEVGQVVLLVVPLRLRRGVPQLGADLLGGHAEALLAVGRQGGAEAP